MLLARHLRIIRRPRLVFSRASGQVLNTYSHAFDRDIIGPAKTENLVKSIFRQPGDRNQEFIHIVLPAN